MNASIANYLTLAYRKTVMGHPVNPDSALEDSPEFEAALRAELARIRGLGLGASLAQRDFALYQNQRAIEAALAKLEANKDAAG